MVPTLRCGFVLSNFALAIYLSFLPVPVLPGKDRTVAALPRGLRPRQPIAFAGAHNRIRTDDLALTKGVLCQLSYVGVFPSAFLPGRTPTQSLRILIIGRFCSGARGRIRTCVARQGNDFTDRRF